MDDLFKEIKRKLNVGNIHLFSTVGKDFVFIDVGLYIFISPISGIIKLWAHRGETEKSSVRVERFRNFKLIHFIEVEEDDRNGFYYMFDDLRGSLKNLNALQSHLIKIFGHNKTQINEPGIYELELIADTYNYVNYWKNGDKNPFLLFKAIDTSILEFYSNKFSDEEFDLDHYLNEPFYYFYYNLDGFLIYKEYLGSSLLTKLELGQTYNCKVDYIYRNNSEVENQLTVRKIFTITKLQYIFFNIKVVLLV